MELVSIYNAAGVLEAEMIKTFLESYGITVYINQESLGRTLGLSAGPLGLVEILVSESEAVEAESILNEMWQDENWQVDDLDQYDDQTTDEPTNPESNS